MKKTITVTKQNGEVETVVLEGTPDEIAELERQIRKDGVNENKRGNRRVLTEADVKRLVEEEVSKIPLSRFLEPVYVPYVQPYPYPRDLPYVTWTSTTIDTDVETKLKS